MCEMAENYGIEAVGWQNVILSWNFMLPVPYPEISVRPQVQYRVWMRHPVELRYLKELPGKTNLKLLDTAAIPSNER